MDCETRNADPNNQEIPPDFSCLPKGLEGETDPLKIMEEIANNLMLQIEGDFLGKNSPEKILELAEEALKDYENLKMVNPDGSNYYNRQIKYLEEIIAKQRNQAVLGR